LAYGNLRVEIRENAGSKAAVAIHIKVAVDALELESRHSGARFGRYGSTTRRTATRIAERIIIHRVDVNEPIIIDDGGSARYLSLLAAGNWATVVIVREFKRLAGRFRGGGFSIIEKIMGTRNSMES
jgi:hypothetical protein